MKSSRTLRAAVPAVGTLAVLLVSSASALRPSLDAEGPAERMARRASAMLAALSDGQSVAARAAHDDPERTQWAFGPVQREGIKVGDLDDGQVEALEALLDTALSDAGMTMWRQVQQLESELRRMESTPERVATHRDPDLYWLRVYGTPGEAQRWSWRFEGHHLALHVDCRPDRVPSVTPFFIGARPTLRETETGTESTVNVFGALNRAYRAAVAEGGEALPPSEQPRPRDIRMGPGKDELPPEDGVRFADLEPAVRAKLKGMLTAYLSMLDPSLRTPYEFDPERAAAVRFVRWGGEALEGPRAWTLLTPRFALELFTTDGPGHVHAVLRDVDRDFGGK